MMQMQQRVASHLPEFLKVVTKSSSGGEERGVQTNNTFFMVVKGCLASEAKLLSRTWYMCHFIGLHDTKGCGLFLPFSFSFLFF